MVSSSGADDTDCVVTDDDVPTDDEAACCWYDARLLLGLLWLMVGDSSRCDVNTVTTCWLVLMTDALVNTTTQN